MDRVMEEDGVQASLSTLLHEHGYNHLNVVALNVRATKIPTNTL